MVHRNTLRRHAIDEFIGWCTVPNRDWPLTEPSSSAIDSFLNRGTLHHRTIDDKRSLSR